MGHGGDWKCAVVTGHADARGGDKLAGNEAMRGDRLDGCGCGGRGAATRSGQTRSAGDVRKLRGGRRGDDGKRAVVASDADSRNSHRLPGGETMRSGRGDGHQKTIFGCAAGAGGNRDGGRLRGAVRARRYGDSHIFIHDCWPGLWLTRSKLVSSNWRGRSLPVFPSLMARYSRPKSVVEFA